jgi:3-deoxy-D-manno-octulosonate 8-phosphate phosphatase (KDO 8-P phosphatase)
MMTRDNQMTKKQKTNLADIQLLVMDVDGVLTDGTVMINSDGSEGKFFNLLDGHGLRMWQRAGLKAAFLSGRFSEATKYRAEQLEVDYCIQPVRRKPLEGGDCSAFAEATADKFEKLPALKKLLEQVGLSANRTAYIGDDLLDLPVIRYVGFGAAVANAVDEVKDIADYITTRRGGDGAVREVIEYILKNTGKWQELVDIYYL